MYILHRKWVQFTAAYPVLTPFSLTVYPVFPFSWVYYCKENLIFENKVLSHIDNNLLFHSSTGSMVVTIKIFNIRTLQ